MILCDQNTHGLLRKYIVHVSNFLSEYEWITEAYVSDFFYKDHWQRLPGSWQTALSAISTVELSGLLDKGHIRARQVQPLSLLSFAACTKALALDRTCLEDLNSAFKAIFPDSPRPDSKLVNSTPAGQRTEEDECICSSKSTADPCSSARICCRSQCCSITESQTSSILVKAEDTFSSLGKVEDVDGKLHAFFRKHVKPKKQHEILNLSKVIKLLSDHTHCGAVVDVGAGLGHLSRLLSFGYGLSVTSVEAADVHAPKANKYDREIDRELKKKRQKISEEEGVSDEVKSCLPCHVTSMIYPDTELRDFLAIVSSQRQTDITSMDTDLPHSVKDMDTSKLTSSDISAANNASDGSRSTENSVINKMDVDQTELNKKLSSTGKLKDSNCAMMEAISGEAIKRRQSTDECDIHVKVSKCLNDTLNTDIPVTAIPVTDMLAQETIKDTFILQTHNQTKKGKDKIDIKSKLEVCGNKVFNIDADRRSEIYKPDEENLNKMQASQTMSNPMLKTDCFQNEHKISASTTDVRNLKEDSDTDQRHDETGFILTGLHACGDLTPTFLRFFVNCEAARGLASVGCCYMKISDESSQSDVPGYPMSKAVGSLPHHRLTYNARELACHSADTYSQRLKDSATHLKIHSYRAVLEWLANQICKGFKRTSVHIPSKKSDKMDFKSYATLGLEKLGISTELLTEELLHRATTMTEQWKNVVVFYTLRLSLAPVVETLVLLDRVLYLYEKGYNSALMPIFDSKLSPRNFVLLSWKHGSR